MATTGVRAVIVASLQRLDGIAPARWRVQPNGGAIAALIVLCAAAAGLLVPQAWALPYAVLASSAILFVGVAATSRRDGLVVLLLWLTVMGLVRRLLLEEGGASAARTLLLLEPVALAVLVALSLKAVGATRRTPLSNTVAALLGLALLSVVNPLQGSLATGLAGSLFVAVPMTAFWVGRRLDADAFRVVLRAVAVVSPALALYGLYQLAVGFPSWDRAWIRAVSSTYQALSVGVGADRTIRSFSSLTAASEYALFLTIAMVVALAALYRTSRQSLRIAIVALEILLGVALILASGRGPVVMLAIGIGVVTAVRFSRSALLALVLAILCVGAVIGAARVAGPEQQAPTASSALLAHQTSGLANPLDPSSSTLRIHWDLFVGGLRQALSQPVGRGVGAVTIATQSYGGVDLNTELDPSNMAVALGIPGLLLYLGVVVFGLWTAFRLARARRDFMSLAALGLLVVTFLEWTNGGNYAVAFLPWLALGWVDGECARRPAGDSGV